MAQDFPPHPETGAKAVIPPHIPPFTNNLDGRQRIITPYRADEFERRLRLNQVLWKRHSELPKRIRYGFPIGDFPPLRKIYVAPNHARRPEHVAFIREYLNEQCELGRMEGPYDEHTVRAKLLSPFMTSPSFVIAKAGSPGKFRLVQDCSYKNEDGFSVNDSVEADKFPTKWDNASSVAQIIATVPAGAQVASLDIESAFRNIPILPDHKPFLVVRSPDDPGRFFIDHVCSFGVASGTGLQAQVMDAIVDILTASGIKHIKAWVDDMISFRFPNNPAKPGWQGWTYDYDVNTIFRLTKDLGVPWKPGKCFEYADRVVYVGFLWNLRERSVSLTEEKRQKYIEKLDTFRIMARTNRVVSQKEAMKIQGTLSHITFVYNNGRAYLTNLSTFIASMDGPEPLPAAVDRDLGWWQDLLRVPRARSLTDRSKHTSDVWVDASTTWGIGIIIDNRWDAWELVQDWKSRGRDIGWAEMIALELACLYLEALGYSNTNVVVHCDNTGAIGAYLKGKSGNPQSNLSIRRMAVVCSAVNLGLLPQYVKSEDNLADQISRGRRYSGPRFGEDTLPWSKLPTEVRPFLRRSRDFAYFY